VGSSPGVVLVSGSSLSPLAGVILEGGRPVCFQRYRGDLGDAEGAGHLRDSGTLVRRPVSLGQPAKICSRICRFLPFMDSLPLLIGVGNLTHRVASLQAASHPLLDRSWVVKPDLHWG
jgi:hypothetical protein